MATWSVSRAVSASSGSAVQSAGKARHPPGYRSPAPRNRSGSTAGSSGSEEYGTERDSLTPRVLAVLTRIRRIQVFSEDRPSKRSRPLMTPIHASWTTSSATARVFT